MYIAAAGIKNRELANFGRFRKPVSQLSKRSSLYLISLYQRVNELFFRMFSVNCFMSIS